MRESHVECMRVGMSGVAITVGVVSCVCDRQCFNNCQHINCDLGHYTMFFCFTFQILLAHLNLIMKYISLNNCFFCCLMYSHFDFFFCTIRKKAEKSIANANEGRLDLCQ